MVSLGDTVISLHIPVPTKTQSAKICPNLHFARVGGWSRPTQKKCQDLPKFSWGGGTPDQLKVPRSAQIFMGGRGGGIPDQHQTQSAKICLNFHFLCTPDQHS